VAVDRLAADDPTALALLTMVAWCGPEPVPLSSLTGHPNVLPDPVRPIATDPLVLARCTAILHRRGVATVSPHFLQLHRVPTALLRARSQASEDAPAAGWAASVVGLLDQAAPANVRNPGGWPLWRRLLLHVLAAAGHEAALDTAPADATRLLDRAATYPFIRGELQAALDLCERAYRVRRQEFGDDHPDTLTSASNLALNLAMLGDYQRARALDEDTLTRRRRVLGEDHPDTLTSATQLGTDWCLLGDYPQARELGDQVLRWRRRLLGDDDPDTLTSATYLGLVLWYVGDYRQARQLMNDTLTRSRRVLGEDHPDTLSAAGLVGVLRGSVGDYQGARHLLNETLIGLRRLLGEDHLFTLLVASSLGPVL
jgi:hypothetical protein